MPSIVLVEDDLKICNLLSQYFEMNHFDIVTVTDGSQAATIIFQKNPDLVILDLMLPGLDGLSVCRQIRADFQGKILFLTASDDDMDQVAALEMGADDFVKKPVQPRVLLARVRMLLRRNIPAEPRLEERFIEFGELKLDASRKYCTLFNEAIVLSKSEFDLLWLIACHPDEILSREFLVNKIRGIDYDGVDRTIDNKIVILRKKLGDSSSMPRKIITVRGKGYLFVPDRWEHGS